LGIELSDFEAENETLIGDSLWQVVEIVIGGVPTILEVRFMCFFLSLGRILLQGSVTTNLFGSMRHQVDVQKVEVGIELLGNIYLVADRIPPGVHPASRLGQRPRISICLLVYLSLLREFRSQGISFSLGLFAGSPEKENIFEGVKTTQGILHVAQYCIFVGFISSIYIEF
jgi:hypothetical protein